MNPVWITRQPNPLGVSLKRYQLGGLSWPARAELQELHNNDNVKSSKGKNVYIGCSLGSVRFQICDHCCYIMITKKISHPEDLEFDLGGQDRYNFIENEYLHTMYFDHILPISPSLVPLNPTSLPPPPGPFS
jgi:hypothetical protein